MFFCSLTLLACALTVEAGLDLGSSRFNDEDLTNFVTRPEIKAPKLEVAIHNRDKVANGYFFLAPYTSVLQQTHASLYYQACQSGPAIYDQSGELVWSGACLFKNQNAHDFRTWRVNGTDYLSALLWMFPDVQDSKGHGVILDNTFSVVDEIHIPKLLPNINMHEMNIIDNGRRAIYIAQRTTLVDFEAHGLDLEVNVGFILDLGVFEMDLMTREVVFEWWASDHISVNESTSDPDRVTGPWPNGWNWIHLNSVDKDSNGDYMLSARYTNAIYKISGEDGHVIWTLGGSNSDFKLEEGFNFSRQHDARFLEQTPTTEVITFMDNGGDGIYITTNTSSTLVVTLDKVDMTAKVDKRWWRPDGSQSEARGNFQLLPSGNVLSSWSENAIMTEHSWDGELLMEAEFLSDRMVTYRGYKANFTGSPVRAPDLKVFVYGAEPATSTTVFYVSWNGATEVAVWNFYRLVEEEEMLVGSKQRTGFETSFQSFGCEATVFAEAIDANGSVLGRSSVEIAIVPADWPKQAVEKMSYGRSGTTNTSKSDLVADYAQPQQVVIEELDLDFAAVAEKSEL